MSYSICKATQQTAHCVRSALVACANNALRVSAHEWRTHCCKVLVRHLRTPPEQLAQSELTDSESVGQNVFIAMTEDFDVGEDVIPTPAIESNNMVAQTVQNLM